MTCDMYANCTAEVTMLDQKGYVYCTDHGLSRRLHQPCRKLTPAELRRVEDGQTIAKY